MGSPFSLRSEVVRISFHRRIGTDLSALLDDHLSIRVMLFVMISVSTPEELGRRLLIIMIYLSAGRRVEEKPLPAVPYVDRNKFLKWDGVIKVEHLYGRAVRKSSSRCRRLRDTCLRIPLLHY